MTRVPISPAPPCGTQSSFPHVSCILSQWGTMPELLILLARDPGTRTSLYGGIALPYMQAPSQGELIGAQIQPAHTHPPHHPMYQPRGRGAFSWFKQKPANILAALHPCLETRTSSRSINLPKQANDQSNAWAKNMPFSGRPTAHIELESSHVHLFLLRKIEAYHILRDCIPIPKHWHYSLQNISLATSWICLVQRVKAFWAED